MATLLYLLPGLIVRQDYEGSDRLPVRHSALLIFLGFLESPLLGWLLPLVREDDAGCT